MSAERDLFIGVVPFVVTADTHSFRKAAAQLGLTPSAVSKAISRLEAELGARLLNRTSRSVSLTEEGELFLRSCRDAVANVRAARARIIDLERTPRGTLTVALPLILGKKLVLPALKQLLELHPRLTIRARLSDRFVQLAEEHIDVAVRIGAVRDPRLRRRELGRVRWVTVASSAYLARRGQPEHPAQLVDHNCLSFVLPNGALQPWQFEHVTDGAGAITVAVRGSLVSDHGDGLIDAAASGLGIFQAHDYSVAEQLASGELVEVLGAYAVAGPPVSLLFVAGKRSSPKVRAFIDWMVERWAQLRPERRSTS